SVFSLAGAGSTIVLAGTDAPLDQAGDLGAAWLTVNQLSSFSQDLTGANWCALGRVGTNTAVDTSVVVNNHVKIQEGYLIPGSSFTSPVTSIADAQMEPNGDWYAWGRNVDNGAWVVRNGVVIAAAGQSITPGSSEHWKAATAFIQVQGN